VKRKRSTEPKQKGETPALQAILQSPRDLGKRRQPRAASSLSGSISQRCGKSTGRRGSRLELRGHSCQRCCGSQAGRSADKRIMQGGGRPHVREVTHRPNGLNVRLVGTAVGLFFGIDSVSNAGWLGSAMQAEHSVANCQVRRGESFPLTEIINP